MKPGDSINIKATVLRVDGNFLHAQTANGQLIQTDVSNVMKEEKLAEAKKGKSRKRVRENPFRLMKTKQL